jgi:hypothetical protein
MSVSKAIQNWRASWERGQRQYKLQHDQQAWEEYLNEQPMSVVIGNLEAYDYD